MMSVALLTKALWGKKILLTLAILALAACGGDTEGDTESDAGSGPSSPAPAPAEPPESVSPPEPGEVSVTLSWSPPADRVDGSALDDLQGYRIRYGYDTGEFPYVEHILDPSATSHVIEGLQPRAYHFVIHSVDAEGVESPESDEILVVLGD